MTKHAMVPAVDAAGLAALEARVVGDLAMVAHPAKDWLPERRRADGGRLYDVLIAGAGQGGLAVASALQRERVGNILVLDEAPVGREGMWRTYARMPTLRSPKEFTGPDLGIPSLTYQAWHEAAYGTASWAALERIPTGHWSAYLDWYRRVLRLPVRNAAEVVAIGPAADGLAVTVRDRASGGEECLFARKMVLATGQVGMGRWHMPDFIAALPPGKRATSADAIDFPSLAGKVVAVLGQGASAADNAATALEHGAAAVHMFVRRQRLQRVQPYLWLTFSGFLRHLRDLPDEWRWRLMRHILELRESFPQATYDRMRRHANFTIHTGAGWRSARVRGERVEIDTAKGAFAADFVICGTGIDIDPAARPELATAAPYVATWGDRYRPPAGEESPRLARFPYLGPDGELTEKVAGTAPWLARIHDFTMGATVSLGPSGCSINAMNIAVPRLVAGLTRGLFTEDLAHHWRTLQAWDETIFEPAEVDRDKV
jgi:cation diffusion facilitator CzcD-associated flavoprotein CzcO